MKRGKSEVRRTDGGASGSKFHHTLAAGPAVRGADRRGSHFARRLRRRLGGRVRHLPSLYGSPDPPPDRHPQVLEVVSSHCPGLVRGFSGLCQGHCGGYQFLQYRHHLVVSWPDRRHSALPVPGGGEGGADRCLLGEPASMCGGGVRGPLLCEPRRGGFRGAQSLVV